jgi:hypothetical protein
VATWAPFTSGEKGHRSQLRLDERIDARAAGGRASIADLAMSQFLNSRSVPPATQVYFCVPITLQDDSLDVEYTSIW